MRMRDCGRVAKIRARTPAHCAANVVYSPLGKEGQASPCEGTPAVRGALCWAEAECQSLAVNPLLTAEGVGLDWSLMKDKTPKLGRRTRWGRLG